MKLEAPDKTIESRLAELEQQVAILRNGGCTCESPMWYYASLMLMYRCSDCGAVVSPALASEAIKTAVRSR